MVPDRIYPQGHVGLDPLGSDRLAQHRSRATPRGRKGALSHFVEEAVQARILELQPEQAKARNATVQPDHIERAIDEALGWTRRA
jgi:hypothetical protein